MESLKIGFVGSGFIAKFIAEAMKQVRHIEIAAIYNRLQSQKLAQFIHQNKLGEAKIHNSIKEVCQKCDAVAILSPNFRRLGVMGEIAEAVQSGVELIGVICEKPLGRTIAEAETALEKSTASRGLLAVQPNEANLYGYIGELKDMRDAFLAGKNTMLD